MSDIETRLVMMTMLLWGFCLGTAFMSAIQPQPRWFGFVLAAVLLPFGWWLRWNLLAEAPL